MTELEQEQTPPKFADISDRIFATTLDLSLLYFVVDFLTGIVISIAFPDGNTFNHVKYIVVQQHPEFQTDGIALVKFMQQNHPEEYTMMIRQIIFTGAFQFSLLGAYFVWFTYKKGRTIGKYILGLKVVDNITYKEVSISQSLIRYIGYAFSAIPFGIGLIYGSFNKRKRCFHDFMGDTVVIYASDRWYGKATEWLKNKIRRVFSRKK